MVRFIIGSPCSGKTHFRKRAFPELPYVDLLDVQREQRRSDYPVKYASEAEQIKASYDIACRRLLALMKDNDDVVFEHTLMKSCRRDVYIKAIRKAYPGATVLCYCMYPGVAEHARRTKERFDDNGFDGAGRTQEEWENETADERARFDLPDLGEGFDQITVVRS